ncbi:alpha,alpha-phosphotrehalase [Xenorhabdus nematophila]|uniref:Alpha,alpha-phosphotrehalase n=1 Tax=Xenorhabdus nematophila (strain ATCC 19061 / DSM 3370 / CCUG 14189 / LMG 1036 / NCIMB 9965 / AN6) TaxID=406817 RepID=D3VFU4_XENNA|nr:alpha,alpha-phosphotrehalase [Xenorhabdus nematophila]CEE92007.1 trehalose-6-P hydrolase, alternative inducer of maltose system, cytoplasmic [Xenorhabdus nematophila str. Anatoliense]CEF32143.1 trehalose-6-P hydrolase, alternative inducer of maltose system, cytoplasmic [Xenorhabdus nematophila str. Websteri]AYA41723.1 alpha,alpha-phosphotrehalase [Xenorhabdus nematophila]KHD29072.1 trehalose-6-phosphate hydrolase [Xenorhabdus nematophila]MBA0020462.1 alpha,alpha-phosphotrehalase [Xenorhabdu
MTEQKPWWIDSVIYQIYPKSFQDSTGSGTGDINGITQRLDYLQKLGVDAIWITPFYPSPQVDNGYDVADYCDINPDYGSMADFDHLVQNAHQRGIRIILDMVFNHTSTQHPWFQAAQDIHNPYRQFYIWRDGSEGSLPNNWKSKFGGNAWQWHAESQQYYLHLFAAEQADLNWEHEPVRAELKKICEFWADRGVDGLRLDVVNLVSKQQDFPDDDRGDGRRFYTDGPRIHEFLQEMSRDVLQPKGLMTVGEMSSTRLEHCQRYSALDGTSLSMTFNFHHLKVDYPNGEKWTRAKPDYIELKKIFSTWQQGMHQKAWSALFWCNHDQPRIVSRFGDEHQYHKTSAKMLAMLLHGMQGTPYIYQGEELGMTNPHFARIEDYRDIESLNMYQKHLEKDMQPDEILAILAQKSRDNSRTPMQWDSSANAGFTTGTPWITPCSNYPEINTEAALQDKDSVFYCYHDLIRLRKQHPILTYGDYQDLLPEHPSLWCYLRRWQDQHLLVIANLSDETQCWSPESSLINKEWQVLISNYSSPEKPEHEMKIKPYEAVYLIANK